MPLLEPITPGERPQGVGHGSVGLEGQAEFGPDSMALDEGDGIEEKRSERTGYGLRDRAPVRYGPAQKESRAERTERETGLGPEKAWIIDVAESKVEQGNKLYKVVWQMGDEDGVSPTTEQWIDRDPLWSQGGHVRQMKEIPTLLVSVLLL